MTIYYIYYIILHHIILCMYAVPFIPMPMPKPVCRTNSYNKILQLEVRRTFSGRGMGMNITAQYAYGEDEESKTSTSIYNFYTSANSIR